ncbi:MAG: NAD(P)-dependent oxidoreductase [Acidobacteria bacterium]|nr:NAD(P)-dependent oxidoreductase [Acidobacteriota bacterium]
MHNRRVLVVGAAGRLGAAIVDVFADREVIAHTRASLDITDPTAVIRAVERAAPAVVVNCAAFNDVDGAEDRPVEALATNAFGVRTLARAADAAGATLVHYGSDFVFDGTATAPYDEDASPSPMSTYAVSKLLGEWFALDAARGFVLRVESLFGGPRGSMGRRGSLDAIVEGLQQGRAVPVFTDRVVSPSYVDDIARATKHLIDSQAPPGVYHCVNSGCATWYEIAAEAARILGVTPRLEPITVDQVRLKARRPRFCALANGKLAAAGFAMPAWHDALRRWLARPEGGIRHDTMDRVHG